MIVYIIPSAEIFQHFPCFINNMNYIIHPVTSSQYTCMYMYIVQFLCIETHQQKDIRTDFLKFCNAIKYYSDRSPTCSKVNFSLCVATSEYVCLLNLAYQLKMPVLCQQQLTTSWFERVCRGGGGGSVNAAVPLMDSLYIDRETK